MTRDELRALYRHFIGELETTRLGLQQLRVAKLIAVLSFGCGRTAARITRHEDIASAVWMDRHDVSDVLAELSAMRIVRVSTDVIEPLPDSALWQVQRRWKTDAQRAKGEAMLAGLVRFQGIEQPELLEPEPDFDSALAEVSRDGAQDRIAKLPALQPTPGTGHRGDASLPAMPVSVGNQEQSAPKTKREEALEMRAQIAQSLREAGWTADELKVLDDVPADRLGLWASHPRTVGESPTANPVRVRACVQTIGTSGSNATGTQSIQSIQCGEVSPARKWRSIEELMTRVRRAVGEENAGYWFKILRDGGAASENAAFEALCEWELRRGPVPDNPSRYLFGIYRRFLKQKR